MSRTGTPKGPLLLANGNSDSTGDGVTIAKDVEDLAHTYCQRGSQSSSTSTKAWTMASPSPRSQPRPSPSSPLA